MSKPTIFISHIGEEKNIAIALKDFLDKKFLKSANIFVSSHDEGLKLGDDWFSVIKQSMDDCQLMILLCSPISITRPWVNFEAGAGWIKNIPVIPLCHSGMEPGKLPVPINKFQGAMLNNVDAAKRLFKEIANVIGTATPEITKKEFPKSISEYENEILQSQLNSDISFVMSILQPVFRKLDYIILSANFSVEEKLALIARLNNEEINMTDIDLKLESFYHIFDTSAYSIKKESKVYDTLFEFIDTLNQNIRFILTYNSITLPTVVKGYLHECITATQSAETMYVKYIDSLDEQENILKLAESALKSDEENAIKRHLSVFFGLTTFLAKWITQFENECYSLIRK